MTTLKVSKVTKTKNDGVNLVTVKRETVDALLGTLKETFYFGSTNPFSIGQEVQVDLNNYSIEMRDYQITDKNTGEVKNIKLKYLKPRR